MSMFKKAKVVMLSTNEKINIIEDRGKFELIKNAQKANTINSIVKGYHLYIISDDEIKENDWYLGTYMKSSYYGLYKCDSKRLEAITKEFKNVAKKVIASTDSSLELPQPSKQFIEKYIEEYNKDNIITDILVEYEDIIYNPEKDREYQSNDRINIEDCDKQTRLKINPKDNTITIKKIKEIYTKDEVIRLLERYISFLWQEIGIHYPISLGKDAKDKFINSEL